ncbi:MAG: hypothetical protein JXX29_02760 [Deltaproteobacteria bacterium]|nr:hypothetical protein [Deltaproteobacteria bacterium]MBN2670563.1 hypothetical protein [Deltaproteobacteria bacterium]
MRLFQLFAVLFLLAFSSAGIFIGCGEDNNENEPQNTDADADSDSDGDSDADSDTDSDTDGDPEPNGTMPSDAGEVCGNVTCEANLDAAKTALINGNYTAAYESYRCGDTVEAAAGAALTKLLTILESAEATALWADFGVTPPVSPKDLIGPGGLLYQLGTYYNGTLDYTLSGSESSSGVYPARIELGGGPTSVYISGDADADVDVDTTDLPERFYFSSGEETRETNMSIDANIQPTIPLTVGDVIELNYDCETNSFDMPALVDDFQIDIWGDFENREIECYVSDYSSFSTCPTQPGAIEVLALGDFNQPVSFSFTDVPINCYSNNSTISTLFTGTFAGTLNDGENEFNTDGMHMIFDDPEAVFSNIPTTLTVNQLIDHLSPLADDFEEAACYAAKADNSSDGPVYYIPSAITGHQSIPLFTRDMKMIASAYYAAAAMIYFAASYDVPLQVGAMEDMSSAQLVEEVNAHIGSLKATNQLLQSRAMLQQTVNAALAALASKENDGLFPSNSYTAAGEAAMLDYVNFINDSLQGGSNLPHTVPAIQVNLGALFSSPMNPQTVNADPLVLTNGDIEAVELFFQELLGDIIPDFSYDMEDYDYGDEGEQIEQNAYEFEYAICKYLGLAC